MRKKKQLVVKSTERKLVNRMEGNTHLCRKPHNVSNAESIVFGLYADIYAEIIKKATAANKKETNGRHKLVS